METISENGTLKATYHYDTVNQLVREDNLWLNKTIVYTYDKGGNIYTATEYAYTTASEITSSAITTNTYTYGSSNWKDKLTAYNGTTITYDEIGNPLQYYNGYEFTWDNGRQLASAANDSYTITYKYDANGIRTQKTVNGVTTSYILDGSNVVKETNGTDTLWFYYDAAGSVVSFQLNGTSYFYVKNLQGDIVAITNASGTKVVEYTYDSWGKLISTTGSLASTVGVKNPYRYRGYRYDTETGLYYLNSRYYDPEIKRFINADELIGANQDIISCNLFAYCSNNPVNFFDPSGNNMVSAISTFTISIKVSLEMFMQAVLGNGESMYYDDSSNLSTALKNSDIMSSVVEEHLKEYKSSGLSTDTYTGSVSLYGKDNKYDFDLSYSVGKASYSMTIKKKSITTGFWIFKKTRTAYIINVIVFDTYNFDEYRDDDSFSSFMNNLGYDLQNYGTITPYYWEANYTIIY